jgi:hypothetical protein
MSARPAALNAHTQLCRICSVLKQTSEFSPGHAYCKACSAEMSRRGHPQGIVDALRREQALGRPRGFSEGQRRAAITKHAVGLDLALFALFAEGGFGAVQIGVAEAVKRLGERRRVEINAEGWIV